MAKIDKDWCLKMAQQEDDSEIGAGKLAIDPVLEDEDGCPLNCPYLDYKTPDCCDHKCPDAK